jgi:hypothetical protein
VAGSARQAALPVRARAKIVDAPFPAHLHKQAAPPKMPPTLAAISCHISAAAGAVIRNPTSVIAVLLKWHDPDEGSQPYESSSVIHTKLAALLHPGHKHASDTPSPLKMGTLTQARRCAVPHIPPSKKAHSLQSFVKDNLHFGKLLNFLGDVHAAELGSTHGATSHTLPNLQPTTAPPLVCRTSISHCYTPPPLPVSAQSTLQPCTSRAETKHNQ